MPDRAAQHRYRPAIAGRNARRLFQTLCRWEKRIDRGSSARIAAEEAAGWIIEFPAACECLIEEYLAQEYVLIHGRQGLECRKGTGAKIEGWVVRLEPAGELGFVGLLHLSLVRRIGDLQGGVRLIGRVEIEVRKT